MTLCKQLTLDLNIKPQGYKVYINSRRLAEVATLDDAWAVVGGYSFGSCYEIHDVNGIVPGTIPF
jgi:hypothetical protein